MICRNSKWRFLTTKNQLKENFIPFDGMENIRIDNKTFLK